MRVFDKRQHHAGTGGDDGVWQLFRCAFWRAFFYRIHKHHDKIGPVEVATIKADVDWGEVVR